MEHLFYFMVILCFLFELFKIPNATDICNFIRKNNEYKKVNGKVPEYSSFTPNQKTFYTMSSVYTVVCLIGLFSSQWLLFLAIFLQTIVMVFIRRKYPVIIKIDSTISAFILLFIVINKYHIHLDLFNLIFN